MTYNVFSGTLNLTQPTLSRAVKAQKKALGSDSSVFSQTLAAAAIPQICDDLLAYTPVFVGTKLHCLVTKATECKKLYAAATQIQVQRTTARPPRNPTIILKKIHTNLLKHTAAVFII